MRVKFLCPLLVGACLFVFRTGGFAADGSQQILAKAVQVFGEPLNAEHQVYRFNDNYVIWLIFDTRGELLEVDVGPRSYYSAEFPSSGKHAKEDHLSDAEYADALRKISQLKDIGKLQERHSSAVPSDFGPLNTDRFDGAFADRILSGRNVEGVKKFNIYFLQGMEGSPEQIKTVQGQSMVCLVDVWYYLRPGSESKVKLGMWQTLQVAGPTLRGARDCFRTTILRDADGFTIEEPQNETIVLSKPYRVRVLAGRVATGDQPEAGVNVEVRRIGSENVLRTKTDAEGNFKIPDATEGEYKFKVTKDGFKALSGRIFVRHNAASRRLSFELHVGT